MSPSDRTRWAHGPRAGTWGWDRASVVDGVGQPGQRRWHRPAEPHHLYHSYQLYLPHQLLHQHQLYLLHQHHWHQLPPELLREPPAVLRASAVCLPWQPTSPFGRPPGPLRRWPRTPRRPGGLPRWLGRSPCCPRRPRPPSAGSRPPRPVPPPLQPLRWPPCQLQGQHLHQLGQQPQ